MNVKILRVNGIRSREPVILANIDGHGVRWSPRRGWECDCVEADDLVCPHVDLMADLLDPRVLNGDQ